MSTISKASNKADLIKYAREELGLNPDESLKKDELIALIEANGGQFSGASSSPAAPVATSDIEKLCASKVRIKLYDKEGDQNKQLTMGVNGVHYTLMRGKEMTVPYPVYEVLKNGVTIQRTHVKGELVEREVQTEPFTVVKFDVQPGDYPEDNE